MEEYERATVEVVEVEPAALFTASSLGTCSTNSNLSAPKATSVNEEEWVVN